ncbi:hypothetical protein [Burkholderia stagnalis]|uniref:hypothetical protein n=1 Tax=Burkholderia stagnalis TaxID=1503054 RepID=UPI000AC32847|nr:hypothetical protein [Burkholderia stagnalis]MDY7806675.1 hypothetical protein [Burkholderia stagnalis]
MSSSPLLFARLTEETAKSRRDMPRTEGLARDQMRWVGAHANFPHLRQFRAEDEANIEPLSDATRGSLHVQWLRSSFAFVDEAASQMEGWYQTISLMVPEDRVTSTESKKDVEGTYRGHPGKAIVQNVLPRALLQSLVTTPTALVGGAVGGLLGSSAGPAGTVVGAGAGASAAGQAGKQAYKNLEKLAGKKYKLNTRLKSLYPSVKKTDAELSSKLMQYKISPKSVSGSYAKESSAVANKAYGRGVSEIKKTNPTAGLAMKVARKFLPLDRLGEAGYQYVKGRHGLSDDKRQRMLELMDSLEYALDDHLYTAKAHMLAINPLAADEGMDAGVDLSAANRFQTAYFDWKSRKQGRITLNELSKKYTEALAWIRKNRTLLSVPVAQAEGPIREFAVRLAEPETDLDEESD